VRLGSFFLVDAHVDEDGAQLGGRSEVKGERVEHVAAKHKQHCIACFLRLDLNSMLLSRHCS
jgi:hypothetical protein